jgi:hypothetical protein
MTKELDTPKLLALAEHCLEVARVARVEVAWPAAFHPSQLEELAKGVKTILTKLSTGAVTVPAPALSPGDFEAGALGVAAIVFEFMDGRHREHAFQEPMLNKLRDKVFEMCDRATAPQEAPAMPTRGEINDALLQWMMKRSVGLRTAFLQKDITSLIDTIAALLQSKVQDKGSVKG